SMAPAAPAIPRPPSMAPAAPAIPRPPSMATAPAAPSPVPSGPAPVPRSPAPAPAQPEFEIQTETQWVLVSNQVDLMGVMIVDGDGNCVFGADDMGYPLDSTGQPFQQAQYLEKVVEKRVPRAGAAPAVAKEKVQVLVPNQVDAYGMEIVDASNNPVYGMDPSGWYAMDSAGQAFEQTQWMEVEVEKQPEKGPFPPNLTDSFGVQVVDDKGFAIYGSDEFNQPLDPNGKGVWWEGSSRPKYPDMIDIGALAQKKNGMVLTPRVDNTLGDKFMLSARNVEALGLYEGMMIEIEDHKTRGTGAGRIKVGSIEDRFIGMTQDAYDAANIVEKDDVVTSSAEPPIEKREVMTVNVKTMDDFGGMCAIGPRLSLSLNLGGRSTNEVMSFEDPLTGSFGAAKVKIDPELPENMIKIDSEIYEASGIGSDQVEIRINRRKIIPIQEATIGINPITGDQVWEVLAKARRFVGNLKSWLSNYIVFKDLKLRWKQAGALIKILDSKPDLSGDVLAEFKPTTNILLKPEGLVTFNAILIIDISRSMMARDLLVAKIGPAIEGIKAAMGAKEIQDFLKQFKEGTSVPRRIGAAFAAILFLAEKVGRGFGEKVSIVRFADTAEALDFGGRPYMEGSSGEKNVLENTAKQIVDQIGNAYGQATSMGQAMLTAQELIYKFQDIEGGEEQAKPIMLILLTDGAPTDQNNFEVAVQEIAKNQNVVFYVIGMGQTDAPRMTAAATSCGGEYFEPADAGELLIWYSKRARDLQVRLKSSKKKEDELPMV
ncbi:MAG: VWA domain-containing protein, partial [Candidatus Lokiarchaeota archaeon]|nr:VWA domain-containing protein [Candidatus Lokiarchaeota archaeon]